MFLLALGDGAIVRAFLEGLVDFLHRFASPTGARGSILLMSGGLIVLGFLFLALLFRSAVVGDLAPVANARAPIPRVHLPGRAPPPKRAIAPPPPGARGFDAARAAGASAGSTLDEALDALRSAGLDARVVQSHASWKRLRLYRCGSCDAQAGDCERERGLLAGVFEGLTGQPVQVEEGSCRGAGFPACEFDVRHGALPLARAAP